MTPEQQIAYLNAMVACALIEAKGMEAENLHQVSCGNSISYGKEEFDSLIVKYGIHHNGAMTSLIGG